MNEIRLAIDACGLSQREAADFLDVRLDTVNKAVKGRDATPPGWLRELRALHQRQREAAAAIMAEWKLAGAPKFLEIAIPADDDAAHGRPFLMPCVNARLAVARMVWEQVPARVLITLVPHGIAARTD